MRRRLVLALGVAPLLLAGCSPSDSADDQGATTTVSASELVKVSAPHAETGGTLLEGPTFDSDGSLFVVDVMAPPGAPKVLRIDVDDPSVSTVYTDDTSGFTSAQFSPVDDRLYLTDIATGSIVSMSSDGTDATTIFSGPVDGASMLPDDLTFDDSGTMFVSDTTGMQSPVWEAAGRVVRVSTEGTAQVIATDLPSPNGIVFDESGSGLWVSQYNANRIDYFLLSPDGRAVDEAYPAIRIDAGRARVDSTAVDAAGNLYQAFHGKPEVAVLSPDGDLLRTIRADGTGLDSATNVAIAPGTHEGYMTVSGPRGGFIYTFDALAEGTRRSNGG